MDKTLNMYWLLFFGLIVFLSGFCIGKKIGENEGHQCGLREAPLEIKKISLEMGECLICGIAKNFHDFAGKP